MLCFVHFLAIFLKSVGRSGHSSRGRAGYAVRNKFTPGVLVKDASRGRRSNILVCRAMRSLSIRRTRLTLLRANTETIGEERQVNGKKREPHTAMFK